MPSAISTTHETLSRDGFVVIRDFLSPTQLDQLREAAAKTTDLARSGKWPFLRTVGKQFPPWPADHRPGVWGVQHILHPDLPQSKDYARNYFGDEMTKVFTEIMECKEDELVMELYNMLVGVDEDYALRWHRDDIPNTASVEEEERRLCGDKETKRSYAHAQWNIALYDDDALVVVPGSHRRARTEAERAADEYAKEIENMKVVHLGPGDAVFYDHNILHRGVYTGGKVRATLHGTVGMTGTEVDRARVILQHGVGDWVRKASFADIGEISKRAEGMRKRLIKMDDAREGKDVGFSLEG